MSSMEVVHDSLLERLWDDWSVMEHDYWTDCYERVSVWEEVLDGLVPPVFDFWSTC